MKYASLLYIYFLFTACSVVKPNPNEEMLVITTIEVGILTGAGQEGFNQTVIAINSIDEWKAIREKMNSINTISYDLKIDDFDFTDNMLYIHFDKVRGTKGYTLSVQRNNNAILLTSTPPTGPAAEMLSQPYLLFSTNKLVSEPPFIYIEN